VDGVSAPADLASTAIRAGRRRRRFQAVGGSAALALVVAAGAVLAAQDGGGRDSLITPATQLPSAEPTPSPSPSLTDRERQALQAERQAVQAARERAEAARRAQQDLQVALWLRALPVGNEPQIAWSYGAVFHSPTLDHDFANGGWVVPLGEGGGGFVIELHSDGDTGAGDPDKRTGVLTTSGFRVLDHGDFAHGLSADGRWLASALWEKSTGSGPTGFDLFDTTTGRLAAHLDYDYESANVLSVSKTEVRIDVGTVLSWDIATNRVHDLGPAPEPATIEGQVLDRPFTFRAGTLRELDGKHRTLVIRSPEPMTLHDAVHESVDAVLLQVAGQDTGSLALLRCRFSTQTCERATALGPEGGFILDASLR
jgi:hypothetical protein